MEDRSGSRANADFLLGGGEMGARMRQRDWSRTALGPPERWPQSLKTAVRIMLTSRQPMFVWWGDELVNLYNDAYRSIVGGKHPEALGQPAFNVWREIWDQVGPRAASAMLQNEGTYDEALLLIMERNGYPEETYYTFSYSPVPNDQGGTGGILCANSDDTQRIVGERQLALLRELAATTADARATEEACGLGASCLATNLYDLPFAMIYLVDADKRRVTLAGTSGIERGHLAVPESVDLGDGASPWPFEEAIKTNTALLISDLWARFGKLPTGGWSRAPHQAVAVPIAHPAQSGKAGILLAGLNPFRLFDDSYQGFIELVAAQIAASISNAQAYEEEHRRSEALAELDRAKTTFFSNVSHEFRTPLSLMLGPLDDILARPEAELAAEQRELLQVVQRNGQRLLKLVNTLLDFSRIEAGRVEAVYEKVDLAATTADLASVFRAAVEKAGMRLAIDCPPLLEPAYVDRDMWEKIVLNLVSNAFKYTLAGEIRVALGAADGRAILTVADTGIGIPADELPNLFKRFYRVQSARGRTHEGTGIGLALVFELAKLHGATVGVESAEGSGSTFTVALPLGNRHLAPERVGAPRTLRSTGLTSQPFVEEAYRWLPDDPGADGRRQPAAAEALTSVPSAARHNGRRPRVLLADDNADMRDYVRRLLAASYDVVGVSNGEEALGAAVVRPPDLVLTDVMMPGLDGFALLKALREDPRTATTPVILLSARAGDEARADGLDAGADDYIVKPFSARELLARVGAQLAMSHLRGEALERERSLRARAEREIEERAVVEAALRASEEALREADRRKDEFLATLAHELRNPLAPIRNGLEIMRLAKGEEAIVQRARAMMDRQLQHMVRLIDDLLDLSRISRGKVELRRERIDLIAVVQSSIETSRPLIELSGHELIVDAPPDPIFVDADVTRLAQVFANLLNNAAKYTESRGRIRITVERRGAEAAVSVEDDGVGIPAEMLPKVFDMFTQIDRPLRQSEGGLGIGLSIVKRLVEMHGGTVEARSAGRGRGSEFIVRVPLAPSAAEARPPAPVTARAAAARQRVLVTDDNVDSASSLALLLELMGNEVRTANAGSQALEIAAAFHPDIIFLDVGMPDLDGYEVCRRFRRHPWGRDALIVALTGWGQEEDKRRSREAGFDHHLVKPIERAMLDAILDSPRAASRGGGRGFG